MSIDIHPDGTRSVLFSCTGNFTGSFLEPTYIRDTFRQEYTFVPNLASPILLPSLFSLGLFSVRFDGNSILPQMLKLNV